MPHISSRKLKKELLLKIQGQLFESIAKIRNRKQSRLLLTELLTPTEQTMIAKRLAAILMLAKGIPAYRVWKTLQLSPSTTSRLQNALEKGAYTHLLSAFSKKAVDDVWTTIEILLRLGMPEMGKRRWDWLDDFSRY